MGEKRPQPTAVLVKRLQRLARSLERLLNEDWAGTSNAPAWQARINVCWQAAARLELLSDPDATICENCRLIATTTDDAGVPLCDGCFAALDPDA